MLSTFAQTPPIVSYRVSTLNSQTVVMGIYSDGIMKQVSGLPSNAVFGRKGGSIKLPYTPEDKAVFNPGQFGLNKYFSPTFRFAVDFDPTAQSATTRGGYGVNTFAPWMLSQQEKATIPSGQGMYMFYASNLGSTLQGSGFCQVTLAQFESAIYNQIPSLGPASGSDPNVGWLVFNIEAEIYWSKSMYTGSNRWANWNDVKDQPFTLESSTAINAIGSQTTTMAALDAAGSGVWDAERLTRIHNRFLIMFQIARQKAAGVGNTNLQISQGAALYNPIEPRLDLANNNGVFLDGSADVSRIGGIGGTITLNNRTYTGIAGSMWTQENSMMGYYYPYAFSISQSEYTKRWVSKIDSTENYPSLWAVIKPEHVTAITKGLIQLNRRLMSTRFGSQHGIIWMAEPNYEGGGIVDGTYSDLRNPFPALQQGVNGITETPKVWIPPYRLYSTYITHRFFAGNDPGWGFYLWNNPSYARLNADAYPVQNHHWHNVTALFQARQDLQPYEQFFTGSTLVEDPEVQLGGVGSFTAYSGTQAYNDNGGVYGPQLPAYMVRYKSMPGGWRVLVLGGMNQGYTDERTDIVRVPGGGLNGNAFRVKLRGPATQVFEFLVKNTDSGQTYDAVYNANTTLEKRGYAGRIVTPSSTTVTSTTTTTTTVTVSSDQINKPVFITYPYSASLTSTAWTTYDTQTYPSLGGAIGNKDVYDNGTVHLEIFERMGATPARIYATGSGVNLINVYDLGRQAGITLYRPGPTSPNPNAVFSNWATPDGGGVGNDPIQCGDTFGNSSIVLVHAKNGNSGYYKIWMKNWAIQNENTDVILEQWIDLDGAAVRVHFRVTCNRTDYKTQGFGRSQEYPMVYPVAGLPYVAYVGSTGGIQYKSDGDQVPFTIGEPWVAAVPSASSSANGLGLWAPYGFKSNQKMFTADGGVTEFNSASNYTEMNPHLILDWNGQYYGEYAFLVGSVSSIRTWALSQASNANYNTLVHNFDGRNGRDFFYYENLVDSGFPTPDDGLLLTGLNNGGTTSFNFPNVGIAASTLPSIYMKYKASASFPTSAHAYVGKPEQTAIQVAGQSAAFTLVCDNAWHTVQIPVGTIIGSSGIINDFHLGFDNMVAGETLKIAWFNTTNTQPSTATVISTTVTSSTGTSGTTSSGFSQKVQAEDATGAGSYVGVSADNNTRGPIGVNSSDTDSFTITAPSALTGVSLQMRYKTRAYSPIQVAYQINGGSWVTSSSLNFAVDNFNTVTLATGLSLSNGANVINIKYISGPWYDLDWIQASQP